MDVNILTFVCNFHKITDSKWFFRLQWHEAKDNL